MTGRRKEINLQLHQILDSLIIALAFWLSHTIRMKLGPIFENIPEFWIFSGLTGSIPPLREFFLLMAIIVPLTPIVLEFQGFYAHPLQKTLGKSLRQMFRTLVVIGVIIGAAVIFFKQGPQSRAVLIILAFVGGAALLLKERLLRRYLLARISREGSRERVVFAGPPDDVRKLHSELPPEMRAAIEVVDEIDISTEPVERLVHCLHDKAVERVIFAAAHVHFGSVEKAIHACEEEGVEAWLSADFIQTAIARPNFDTIGDRLMLVFRSTPEFSWAILFKEFIDKTGALILLILSSPIWLFAAIGIRLSSPGPIIFRQTRGGRHGKPFTMLKFRTMRSDAEEIKKSLQASNQMDGPVFKLDDDPRIFKFGRFLRRKSIDELPQLLNVLAGDMSLVGPRPLPVYEVEKIEESKQRRRLSVKPGLTCLWQVSGRNEITSFEKWVELDLKYIDNWSIWLDIKILARTVPVVLMGSGAR